MTKLDNSVTELDKSRLSTLSEEETKKILTPFAFNIDSSLFGLPLSVPWKRGCALLVDFLLIAMLARTPGELLALVMAVTFFKLGSKKRALALGKRYGFRKRLLRLIGAFVIFVVSVSVIPDLINNDFKNNETTISSATEQPSASETSTINEKTGDQSSDVQNISKGEALIYKGVEWAQGAVKDLGLSFGWAAIYFSVLTSVWKGQTPGKKLFKIRVIQLDGTPLSVWDSFGRYGGYGAGLATGLLGFLQIYWDPNRQAIHDKISSTIVIDLKVLERMNKNR